MAIPLLLSSPSFFCLFLIRHNRRVAAHSLLKESLWGSGGTSFTSGLCLDLYASSYFATFWAIRRYTSRFFKFHAFVILSKCSFLTYRLTLLFWFICCVKSVVSEINWIYQFFQVRFVLQIARRVVLLITSNSSLNRIDLFFESRSGLHHPEKSFPE